MIQNVLNELQFTLRKKLFGPLVIRRGSPSASLLKTSPEELSFYEMILSRSIEQKNAQSIRQVIDVGCRNWSYVQALSDQFKAAHLLGVEVDGYRRYWNLYRRIDLAQGFADQAKRPGRRVQALSLDFREVSTPKTGGPLIFTFFFPFVSEYPCLRWGLPSRFMGFSDLLRHALKLRPARLNQKTLWLSAHQGEWEAEIAKNAYSEVGLTPKEFIFSVSETEKYWPSQHDTHVLVAQLPSGSSQTN